MQEAQQTSEPRYGASGGDYDLPGEGWSFYRDPSGNAPDVYTAPDGREFYDGRGSDMEEMYNWARVLEDALSDAQEDHDARQEDDAEDGSSARREAEAQSLSAEWRMRHPEDQRRHWRGKDGDSAAKKERHQQWLESEAAKQEAREAGRAGKREDRREARWAQRHDKSRTKADIEAQMETWRQDEESWAQDDIDRWQREYDQRIARDQELERAREIAEWRATGISLGMYARYDGHVPDPHTNSHGPDDVPEHTHVISVPMPESVLHEEHHFVPMTLAFHNAIEALERGPAVQTPQTAVKAI